MDDAQRIAANLKTLMALTGIRSQSALSQRSGVSQTNISNILRASVNSQIDTLASLAKALGVDTWQLLAPADAVRFLQAYMAASPDDQEALLRMALSLANYRPERK